MRRDFLRISRDEAGFLLRFFLSFFASYALLHLLDYFKVFEPLKLFVAAAQAALFRSIGVSAVLQGAMLSHGGLAFAIVLECTGLVLVALLFSLLFASRVPAKKLLRALLLFSPFLLAFNVLRVFATLYSGVAFGIGVMDSVHVFLWLVDSLLVLWIWTVAIGLSVRVRGDSWKRALRPAGK